jgi:hypothetical protein
MRLCRVKIGIYFFARNDFFWKKSEMENRKWKMGAKKFFSAPISHFRFPIFRRFFAVQTL